MLWYCIAICSQWCDNGGTCISPGKCSCSSGWSGNDCRTGKYVL